jgi:hypothetical protein
MKHILYIIQIGEGCDYSIACGHLVIHLESKQMIDAIKESLKIIKERYINEDCRLSKAIIYQVLDSQDLSIWQVYQRYDQASKEDKEIEEKERKELIRLQQKYG